jgi:hypothetical protein
MQQGDGGKRARREVTELAEKEVKPDLTSLIADIAREECRKLYEKRLAGLEEELAALYRTLEQYTHPT